MISRDARPLLTVDDLARLLGISPKAVYHRRHRQALPPAIVLGRSLRWKTQAIESWIADQTEPAHDQKRGRR
jgi:prophage regulatory protein